jgi:type IV pilus assembly protein PilO
MNKVFDIISGFSFGKSLIIGLAVAGFYYVTLYNDGTALDIQIGTVQGQLATETQKKHETEETLKQVKEMQEKVGRLSAQYQEISKRLPSVLFSIDINKAIDSFARSAGVSVKIKKPAANVKKEVVEEVPVDITLEGTYAELSQFTYFVSSAEKMSRVKNVTISEIENKGTVRKLKFEGQVVGYKLAPEGENKK